MLWCKMDKKKHIKVYFVDFPTTLENEMNSEEIPFILNRLEKYYDVEIDSKNPDIVFCNIYGNDFIKYDCIRVGCGFEESAPNFSLYDYVLTIFQDFSYQDRVFCYKILLWFERSRKANDLALKKHEFTMEDLKAKSGFCSFVQSNTLASNPLRERFFELLSEYKKVDSGGKVANNIGYLVDDKYEFEKKYKFSISITNGQNFTLQDRPADALAVQTIPIYWGNSDIGKTYNTKSFINCHEFETLEDVVEFVKKVDNDDELYLKMMQEPAFVNPTTTEQEIRRYDEFLINIVENGTIQRSGAYWNAAAEREVAIGRAKTMRTYIFARKLRPLTKVLFRGKIGRSIKKQILEYRLKVDIKKAYK